MKSNWLPTILKYGAIANLLLVGGLCLVIWIQVHWSVAVLFAWMGYGMSSLATGIAKQKHDYNRKIKAMAQDYQHSVNQFNQFISTINQQGEAMRKEMKKCRECEQHPGLIRPGSVHNHGADNCQLKHLKNSPMAAPVQPKSEDTRPQCKLCVKEGDTKTNYRHGNCPVHN